MVLLRVAGWFRCQRVLRFSRPSWFCWLRPLPAFPPPICYAYPRRCLGCTQPSPRTMGSQGLGVRASGANFAPDAVWAACPRAFRSRSPCPGAFSTRQTGHSCSRSQLPERELPVCLRATLVLRPRLAWSTTSNDDGTFFFCFLNCPAPGDCVQQALGPSSKGTCSRPSAQWHATLKS